MFGDPVSNPKCWDTMQIQDVAPPEQYKGDIDEPIWLLNLDMVESQTGRVIEYVYVDKENVGSSTCTFNEDNVLYSKLRPYLNKVVLPDRSGYGTSELIPMKPSNKLNRIFLAILLRSNSFVDYISDKVAGAKMPRVSMQDFRNFECIIPPIDLQNQFAVFVEHTDKLKFDCHIFSKALKVLTILMKQYLE